MVMPGPRPTTPPISTNRPAMAASRTPDLMVFRLISTERYRWARGSLRSCRSGLVVPGVDVDARDALVVEHVDVAPVVVESEAQIEARRSQLVDGHALGVGRRTEVAVRPHDEEVPPHPVTLEPVERRVLDRRRAGREQDDR